MGNAIAVGVLDDNVLVQNEATPWIFAPGIDSAAVITLTALVGVLLFTNQPTTAQTVTPPTALAGSGQNN